VSKNKSLSGIVQFLPVIYVACGVLTLALTRNLYSTVSGVLFVAAGVLAMVQQSRKTSRRSGRSKRRARSGNERSELRWEDHLNSGRSGRSGRRADSGAAPREAAPAPAAADSVLVETEANAEVQPIPELKDGDPVTAEVLARFSPFDKLPEQRRESLAEGLSVSRKPAGKLLIERGSLEDTTLYLLEGSLVLKASDGKKVTIESGTPRAGLPICQLWPHAYSVKTATPVMVVILSQTMVRDATQSVTSNDSGMGIEVSEQPLDVDRAN